MSKRYGSVFGAAGLGLALHAACSPSSGAPDPSVAAGKGNQHQEAGTGDNVNGGGNGSSDGGGGIIFGGDASRRGNGDGALTSDSACGKSVLAPEAITVDASIVENIHCTAEAPQPLALYIMLDNSGSMDDSNKWKNAVAAITSFVKSDTTAHGSAWTCVNDDGGTVPPPSDLPPPGAGSISVAIQYFHPQNAPNNSDVCDGSAHSTPAVPMDVLPDNAQPIIDSLGKTSPGGDTPTTGALTGGTQYCASYQAAHPDKKCVVVLVTDGQPNGCGLSDNCPPDAGNNNGGCVDPNSARVLTPIAGDAFSNDHVITFTVGMSGISPAGFVLLNTIASFGGSDCTPGTPGDEACNVTTGGAQAFLDALNTIRSTVQVTGTSTHTYSTTRTVQTTLACEWLIPKPAPGETFDKGHVNVTFASGGKTTALGNVSTVTDCAAAGDGWYYDDPDAPTKIETCPDTCTKIKTSTDAKVQLLVGCVTQPAIFH